MATMTDPVWILQSCVMNDCSVIAAERKAMRLLWAGLFCGIVLIVPVAADEGWVSLFDGSSLNGWKQAEHGKAKYEVVDGTIHGTTVEGSPNSFLMTEAEYGDFELEFDVKVHPELNSGCQIRSRGKTAEDVAGETSRQGKAPKGTNGAGRFHGPQVEIESTKGFSGFVYGEATGRGWLSPEPADPANSHKLIRVGDWNHFRIVAKGNRIQTFINGKPVADLTHDEIYKSHPRGHIGLQVHGIKAGTGPFDVAWKNLRLRKL